MSIALKYTTLKDASLPSFNRFRSRGIFHGNGKLFALISMTVLAAVVPLFFLYALVGPQGYRPWSLPQAQENESAFLEEYAASPIPQQAPQDYLTSR